MVPKLELPPSLHMPDLLQCRRSATVRHGLVELQKYISFELFRDKLEELCHFSSKGRPHYDVVQMFKILILQTLYNLSDEEMEFQLSDRLSFQRFVGIGYADDVPDAHTIWKFRERLGEKGTKQLFELFFAEIKNRGLKCSQGKLVDATFQEAPRQRNTPEENKIIISYNREREINNYRNKLRDANIYNINNREYDYQEGIFYRDIVGEAEKLGDYVLNVVEGVKHQFRADSDD